MKSTYKKWNQTNNLVTCKKQERAWSGGEMAKREKF